MQVHAAVLANELRRRKVGARAVTSALATVDRSTWIMGELRDAPTSILVLAALSLTSGTGTPPLTSGTGTPPLTADAGGRPAG